MSSAPGRWLGGCSAGRSTGPLEWGCCWQQLVLCWPLGSPAARGSRGQLLGQTGLLSSAPGRRLGGCSAGRSTGLLEWGCCLQQLVLCWPLGSPAACGFRGQLLGQTGLLSSAPGRRLGGCSAGRSTGPLEWGCCWQQLVLCWPLGSHAACGSRGQLLGQTGISRLPMSKKCGRTVSRRTPERSHEAAKAFTYQLLSLGLSGAARNETP